MSEVSSGLARVLPTRWRAQASCQASRLLSEYRAGIHASAREAALTRLHSGFTLLKLSKGHGAERYLLVLAARSWRRVRFQLVRRSSVVSHPEPSSSRVVGMWSLVICTLADSQTLSGQNGAQEAMS